MIVQNKLVDPEFLDTYPLWNAPLGQLIEDGKYLVMTIEDAKFRNLEYTERRFGGIGPVAVVPL